LVVKYETHGNEADCLEAAIGTMYMKADECVQVAGVSNTDYYKWTCSGGTATLTRYAANDYGTLWCSAWRQAKKRNQYSEGQCLLGMDENLKFIKCETLQCEAPAVVSGRMPSYVCDDGAAAATTTTASRVTTFLVKTATTASTTVASGENTIATPLVVASSSFKTATLVVKCT
jgi:hypothetical protein